MRELVAGSILAVVLAAACQGGGASDDGAAGPGGSGDPTPGGLVPARRDLVAYEGLGAWVDAFDYGPAYQRDGSEPPLTPASVDAMAALGVDTLYLQAARDDDRSPGPVVDDDLVSEFLQRAHAAGVRVVAWYLPKHTDVDRDLERIRALLDYRAGRDRFDGVALDVEWTQGEPDVGRRNRSLVELARRLDAVAGDDPIGAIVLPPVALEVINPKLWPAFPWRDLAPHFDVWLPMSYWTVRDASSRYRDAFTYTDENIRRLRADLGDDAAPVHPIGGIGDAATRADDEGFVRAATGQRAIGWSIYDFLTQSSASWEHLRSP